MIFSGVLKALLDDKDGNSTWQDEFDLSRAALPRSFFAVALYIPTSFIIARAAVKYNDVPGHVPYLAIAVTLTLIALSFPLVAYILVSVFDRQSEFRQWVIVRNWTILFTLLAMASGFGLYLINIVPFSIAFFIGMSVYLATLAIDIRLAQRIAVFDIIGAIFAGILISATNIMILLFSMNQAFQ